MDKETLCKLNKWYEESEFQNIVDEISLMVEEEMDYDVISHLARALNGLKRYDEAVETLLSVEKEGKDDYHWHYMLGYAYFHLESFDDARAEFEKAWEMDQSDEGVMHYIGICKEKLQEEAGLKQEDFDPELYTDEQLKVVQRHIERRIGHFNRVFHEIVSPDIRVDVAIIEPTPERNYYTLVTMGMGAHRMTVPRDLEGENFDRAELIICLPPDWPLNSSNEMWFWPVKWLKVMARLPGEQHTWLAWGHTVSNNEPLAENTKLSGVIVCTMDDFDEGADKCILPNGECINFYQIVPLYSEEIEYKLGHSKEELLHLLDGIDYVVDLNRPNQCVSESMKNLAISREEIQSLLLDWYEPLGCKATDRIMVDGEKIGYMYREEPNPDLPDSGWRFFAGDEPDEYLDNPLNSGIYSLNTLCNYDPDIIPLLHAPYGTAYCRDETGKLKKRTI